MFDDKSTADVKTESSKSESQPRPRRTRENFARLPDGRPKRGASPSDRHRGRIRTKIVTVQRVSI